MTTHQMRDEQVREMVRQRYAASAAVRGLRRRDRHY